MKHLYHLLFLICLSVLFSGNLFAQKGGTAAKDLAVLPGALYEVRYWTNMAAMGDSKVYIDTMIYFGDRGLFSYTNKDAVSQEFKLSDSLIYTIMPQFGSTTEKEWTLGQYVVRRYHSVSIPFRKYDRTIYRAYTATEPNKDTGIGEYALVSRQFGVMYRYNNKGEALMLNRIDIYQDGKLKEELDLLSLQMDLQKTDIFTGGY